MDHDDRVRSSDFRAALESVGFLPSTLQLFAAAPGLVRRPALVGDVLGRRPDVITVTAPAGYGKSTFVADLVADAGRPVAWVSLSSAEDQPAVLLSHILVALDEIEPVDPACAAALWARSPTIGSPGAQMFASVLADRRQPFVLVLDDVHEVTSRDGLDCLAVLVAGLPAGSTVVLTSRAAIRLPLGRMRVQRVLVEVGPGQLAFGMSEVTMLLRSLAVEASGSAVERLLERTEGWPVAVYLAAAAQRDRAADLLDGFNGEHRFVAEFLAEELLAQLDADVATFLMEASCLERMSGPLCDSVLQREGSGALLDSLRADVLLVVPLDDHREWYRFHHLMVDFLQQELRRRDPLRATAIHRRVSKWFDANGDGDGAVIHTLRAGDVERAEATVARWYGTVSTANKRYPTIQRWIGLFPPHELTARPLLMLIAAWSSLFAGQSGQARQWLERATAALPERHPDDVHGFVTPVGVALARAIIAPLPPAEIAAEATYVRDHVGLGEGHPLSCFALGAATFMLGDLAESRRLLREGADTTLDRPIPVADCLAHLAIVDIEAERWDEATATARRARAIIEQVADLSASVLILAVSVLVETRAGNGNRVAVDRDRCRQHLIDLAGVVPIFNLQSRIALARAALIEGARAEAAALLDDVDEILATSPGAVGVVRQVEALRRQATTRDRLQELGPGSLTTAELRVLQLLPTHLSLAEIAERLYVSRNTIKSQTIAVYRKLGTSSRSGAVQAAIAARLIDTVAVHA